MRIRRKTSELPLARVNVCDQVTLGFSFESDWLRIEKLLSTNFFEMILLVNFWMDF